MVDNTILNLAARAAQNCIHLKPVIVLGSGASIPHGISGMDLLSKYLLEHIEPVGKDEIDAWLLIRTALNSGDSLEEALLRTSAPEALVAKIVEQTWRAITADDLALLARAVRGEERFPLSDLLSGLFNSVHETINVVTTNYDRVAEYASDIAGLIHVTGFVPGLIRRREGQQRISIRRGASNARLVRIWKVHGSLDWYSDQHGTTLCLPLAETLPDKFKPLIVTPGVSKYERTHDEPFRSAIHGADAALATASSFLCVGYGFRDRHIQPKLVERCRQDNVPTVILARRLTEEAKKFLSMSAGRNYLALEELENGTRVISHEYPTGYALPHQNLWSLEGFKNLVF